MEKNNKIKSVLELLKNSAVILLVFIVLTILNSTVLFIFNISITQINIVISMIFTILFAVIYYKKNKNIMTIWSTIVAFTIFILLVLIYSNTYDLSWDGNAYHKLAVGLLKDGWNPIYQDAETFIKQDSLHRGLNDDSQYSIWIEHYPKASWIFSASIYSVTNNIESSKILNALMIFICFSIFLNYLYKKTNIFYAMIISSLLVINPISICQILNFYIDGILQISIFLIIYSLITITERKDDKESWLILALNLIICINLKFTGLVYSAFFCFAFFVLWLYQSLKKETFKEDIVKYIVFYIVTVSIALLVVGFSPYIKNTINNGNPFYPLFGKGKIDIMTQNQPESFSERNAIEKIIISLFSKSENIMRESGKEPELKIPFTFTKEEIFRYNSAPDLRLAGWGIFTSAIFIISSIIIIIMFIDFIKNKRKTELLISGIVLGIIMLLLLITEGSWWARYVPFVYLIPMIALYYLIKRKKHILYSIFSLILILNMAAIVLANIHYYEYVCNINKAFKDMKEIISQDEIIKIELDYRNFVSVLYNLSDKKIEYELVKNIDVEKSQQIYFIIYENKEK